MSSKYLPLALAAAAIVATQIVCTVVIVGDEKVAAQVFVDEVDGITFDGEV